MAIRVFEKINGKWTIPKDKDSRLFYSGVITEWVNDSGSTIASVEHIPIGVTCVGEADFTGTTVFSFVVGLDISNEEAINSLTWRVTLADGQTEDFSIYFTRVEN